MNFYLLAVNSPFNNSLLTYKSEQVYELGSLVEVPLGKRNIEACVVEKNISDISEVDLEKIKEIGKKLSEDIFLDEKELAFYKWISQYYHYPLGQIIFESLPNILKKPRDLKLDIGKKSNEEIVPNEDQLKIINDSLTRLDQGFSKTLVHGITGSGKSIIYLKIIEEVLKRNKSVLFLIPEINLTPQFIDFFKTNLDCKIYSYHSGVTNSDKFGLWKLLKNNSDKKLIIGVRSSIFLPIQNLGLIITDEEHDLSYKQEDRCPYNARDLAIKKSSLENIPIILGSATPSLETFDTFITTKPKHFYYPIKKRALVDNLPEIKIVDMRKKSLTEIDKQALKDVWPFHPDAIEKIKEALIKNEQVLVFINRLGFSNYLQCNSCGHQFICPNCNVQLKYFKRKNVLDCSYCEYKEDVPAMCPECMNMNLTPMGFGTERVQDVLMKLFPKKVIGRFDRDEIKNFDQLESVLSDFHSGKTDLLVGTQMLSKGHNFKKVNLVVILGIDSQLNFPDFRSNERTYQQLVQVSGRSGRFGGRAQVLIQTLTPGNSLFDHIEKHSFDEFYHEEMNIRKMCQCSPYKRIVQISFNSKYQDRLINECLKIADWMKALISKHFKEVEILGPKPSNIEKRVNKFNWSIMIRSSEVNQLHNFLSTYQDSYKLPYYISQKIDVDPYHLD